MAKIINLMERFEKEPDNIITSKPWEFRRVAWKSKFFIQMLKIQSIRFEKQKRAIVQKGNARNDDIPPHVILDGGLAHTIQGLYMSRHNEEKMREIYYLSGLIDCMINQVNPLLRTDLISDIYQKVTTLKRILNIHWYGEMDRVLFPLEPELFNHIQYKERLKNRKTMKELYLEIRKGTDEMFDILSAEYTFYTPGRG